MGKSRILGVLGLVVCGVVMCGNVASANSLHVKKHTKKEIIDYINETDKLITTKTTYASEPDTAKPYALGELSEETKQSALARLNQYRYIAGLNEAVLDDELGEQAQGAALISAIKGYVDHDFNKPAGMSQNLYQICNSGAANSNLSAKYDNLINSIDTAWMVDPGVKELSHRRNILNPSLKKTGFGMVNDTKNYKSYAAMYISDESGDLSSYNVIWPARLTPISYFRIYEVWSISTDYDENAENISVKVKRIRDNMEWNFDSSNGLTVNNEGYGQTGCIIFKPKIDELLDGDVYTVSITGLVKGDLDYTVEFFDLKTTNLESYDKTETEKSEGSGTGTGESDNVKSEIKKPSVVNGVNLVSGKKKLTVKWKSQTGITGYQIQISEKKNFKTKTSYTVKSTAKSKSITKISGKKLKSRKKYYVRIRAYNKYKDSSGKTVAMYSKWVTKNKKTK